MVKNINQRLILNSPKYRSQKEYWLKTLASPPPTTDFFNTEQPEDTNLLDLTTLRFNLPDTLNRKLINISNGADMSIYIIFLAAINALINYYTGRWDVILQAPVYKTNISKETLNSYVWMRTKFGEEITFKDLILVTKKAALDAYKHQDYPMDDIREQLQGRDEIPEGFIFTNVACTMSTIHPDTHINRLSGSMIFSFHRVQGDSFQCRFQYDSNRYNRESTESLPVYLLNLLENAIDDVNQKITKITCLAVEEEKKLLHEFSHSGGGFPTHQTIVDMFVSQVSKTPHHPVCYREEMYMTYNELNNRSDVLAQILEEL